MADDVQIGFPIFAEMTQLDFTGPWEVLSRVPGAVCHVLAHDLEPVRANGGLAIVPSMTLADCPQLDVVCVPGGPGHLQAMEDAELLDFLRAQTAGGCRHVTSVCTGALVLGAAGLLKGFRATTHWMSHHRLAQYGAIPVHERVVIDRDRMTGGGITAGIDFGLRLAAVLAGEACAREIQLQIEYEPAPPWGGSPDTAEPATLEAIRGRSGRYLEEMAAVDARAVSRLG
jgi:cyclohexyl-isocyanide hydratase